MTSERARTLAFGFLVCSLENLFFQYNEIISTSKLSFHNPLVLDQIIVSSVKFKKGFCEVYDTDSLV